MPTKSKGKRATLVWRAGRSTAIVVQPGKRLRPKRKGEGKVIARRPARANEQAQINKGKWVRTRPPGQPGKKSSIRPKLAAKQKRRIGD